MIVRVNVGGGGGWGGKWAYNWGGDGRLTGGNLCYSLWGGGG